MSKAKEDAVKKTTTTEAVKKATGNEKKSTKERLTQWFRDLKGELKKVVWPTRQQTVKNTTVALALTFASAIVLGAFDYIAGLGVDALIKLVG
ncbi:MAG: preprotein translocase subunit SecE [Firmicutes bacterium HGW-Firmicutes-16]|nr:MAG: preprotein translocase subunit SecE [Firmicutes bacterium HGW-Firmicutes-16]